MTEKQAKKGPGLVAFLIFAVLAGAFMYWFMQPAPSTKILYTLENSNTYIRSGERCGLYRVVAAEDLSQDQLLEVFKVVTHGDGYFLHSVYFYKQASDIEEGWPAVVMLEEKEKRGEISFEYSNLTRNYLENGDYDSRSRIGTAIKQKAFLSSLDSVDVRNAAEPGKIDVYVDYLGYAYDDPETVTSVVRFCRARIAESEFANLVNTLYVTVMSLEGDMDIYKCTIENIKGDPVDITLEKLGI